MTKQKIAGAGYYYKRSSNSKYKGSMNNKIEMGASVRSNKRRKQIWTSSVPYSRYSFLTIVLVIVLQTILLSTFTQCAKTFILHWNTTNSIFHIDNTDHIIDVNIGNQQFEYDQVHLICPVYEPGTFDNETEKYIIYNVSKVEYETCRITNHNPRIIAICDKPQKFMFFTITFRPFTPQPGGLEFLPGNDYYFISTSSKDDLYRRIGGRCTTDNMKVVFKVCCDNDNKPETTTKAIQEIFTTSADRPGHMATSYPAVNDVDLLLNNSTARLPFRHQSPATSVNNNRLHTYTTTRISINSSPSSNGGQILNSGINFNSNSPSSSQSNKPTKKTNEYDKHPNEVVKNEELTYNSFGYRSTRPSSSMIQLSLILTLIVYAFNLSNFSHKTYCSIISNNCKFLSNSGINR